MYILIFGCWELNGWMLGTKLEYLKLVVSHYWCSVRQCRVDHQAIVGNRKVLCVVAPDGDVESLGSLHCYFAWRRLGCTRRWCSGSVRSWYILHGLLCWSWSRICLIFSWAGRFMTSDEHVIIWTGRFILWCSRVNEQGGSYVSWSHLRATASGEVRSCWITCVGLRARRFVELDYEWGGS